MTRITIWDYPVRVFHWAFAICFFAAMGLAMLASEHSQLFDYHMLLGVTIVPIVLLRILWGFIGTKHARFLSFPLQPRKLFNYLFSVVTRKGPRFVGHNPAASYAAIAMLAISLGIVATGFLMQTGEFFEEVHEALAYLMLAVVVVHVLGVVLHVLRHKENIILSMFNGTKEGEESDAISSSRPLIAFILVLLIAGWAVTLVRGYHHQTHQLKLPAIGRIIQLGEGPRVRDDDN